MTEYSRLLDISQPNQLRQFKLVNFINLALAIWQRCLHWIYLSAQIVSVWYQEEAWGFLIVGTPLVFLFSYFNTFFMVIPMYKKFMKFYHKSADYDSLPADAPASRRRMSAVQLEEAAAELTEPIDVTDRMETFLESLRGRRKMDRRQTMPAVRGRMNRASIRNLRLGASAPVGSAPRVVFKED